MAAAAVIAYALGGLSALIGILLLAHIRGTPGLVLMPFKLLAGSLSPLAAIAGIIGAVLGILAVALPAVLLGAAGAIVAAVYVRRVTAPHEGFERAFGPAWRRQIAPARQARLPAERWAWRLPPAPAPRWERDIAFWTVPGTERKLMCDLWQPGPGVEPSGLAVIYFHGSAWYLADKDMGTRPLFRHLAGQGHVVMDAAYRLYPEARMAEMAADVKRAIVWMKTHAGQYHVNPERIVLAGGSAGAHLALLCAYAPYHPALTSEDVKEVSLAVRGVVSWYGPTDLRANYIHARGSAARRPRKRAARPRPPGCARMMKRVMGNDFERAGLHKQVDNVMVSLLGGSPDEAPQAYELFSPVAHAKDGCPPTLLIQGEHDTLVPPRGARTLHRKLQEAGVPVVSLMLPQTDHAFDLMLPEFSPAAQAALYDVDRFLAVLA
jgi:acetyl esterase/lipase